MTLNADLVAEAVGLFAVTNVDDIVILSLFCGQGAGHRGAARRVVVGQYLGFAAILVVAGAAALGATFLPAAAIPYLGLLPLVLGVRAGWRAWTERRRGNGGDSGADGRQGPPKMLEVAGVTFANGGDNIGVFATVGAARMTVYAVVFLILVGVWCAAGRFLATRPIVARALSRWGHLLLPLVLITIGLLILIEGGAFGR
jgi:cadmium resistance protein CadD (predicted permease)